MFLAFHDGSTLILLLRLLLVIDAVLAHDEVQGWCEERKEPVVPLVVCLSFYKDGGDEKGDRNECDDAGAL